MSLKQTEMKPVSGNIIGNIWIGGWRGGGWLYGITMLVKGLSDNFHELLDVHGTLLVIPGYIGNF